MGNSVLIMGIDGASWDFLKPWINDGKLPTLKKLIDLGSSGDLRTVVPPLSSAAWISMVTGKNPGKHGIYGFLDENGQLLDSTSIKSERIWNILSESDKRCCVIGVPLTYPVDNINGCMISGVLTPPDKKDYFYPAELLPMLKKYDYQIIVEFEKNDPLMPDQQNVIERRDYFLKKIYYVMEKKYLAIKELMSDRWDFFMFVISETTHVKDLFWDKKDVVLEFYQKLDSYLDDLIKSYSAKNPNSCIFIVSDHGFSAAPKRSFNFRVWMNNEKIIKDNRTILQKFIPKFYRKLSRMKMLRLAFRFTKTKNIRDSFQKKITQSSNVYYQYPGISINKNGMKEQEYEELRDKIISKLLKMRDPLNNDKVFQIVEKREAVYSGGSSKFAPDVVIIPMSNYANVFSYESDRLIEDIKLNLPGRHFSDMFGIFVAYGDYVRNGDIGNISILDVFPTVLYILGIPIDRDVDGRVLKEIFKPNSELFNKDINYAAGVHDNLSEKNMIKNILNDIKV